MEKNSFDDFISLDVGGNIWDHFYTVAPLVVIGTKENETYDLSPKHMVTPIGFSNYLGFVCTPRHRTYLNIKKESGVNRLIHLFDSFGKLITTSGKFNPLLFSLILLNPFSQYSS